MENDIDGDGSTTNDFPEVSESPGSNQHRMASPPQDSQTEAADSQSADASRPTVVRVKMSVRDSAVLCVCPQGTVRRGKEMALVNTPGGITWIHLPCQPFKREYIADQASLWKEPLRRAAEPSQEHKIEIPFSKVAEDILLLSLGPNATEIQKKKVKNLNRYLCDGPCKDSTDAATYRRCKRCNTWQHAPCMLYGSSGDKGGPVCNKCFMTFVINREEMISWQKKRLAQAGLEALKFIRDPNNEHETSRLEFASTFLGKMISHNKAEILKFVVNRRRVQRFIDSYDKDKKGKATKQDNGSTAPAKTPKKPAPRNRSSRKSIKKESSPPAAVGSDDDYEDNIVVKQKATPAPRATKIKREMPPPLVLPPTEEDDAQMALLRAAAAAKARNKPKSAVSTPSAASSSKTKPKKRPARALSSLSASPPRKAPRKSAPKPSPDEIKDEEDDDDFVPTRELRPRPKGKAKAIVDEVEDDWEDEEPVRKEEGPAISCVCADGETAPFRECFQCPKCDEYQCPRCASRDASDVPLCNFCAADVIDEAFDANDPSAPWNQYQAPFMMPPPAIPGPAPRSVTPKVESTPAPAASAPYTRTPLDAGIANELHTLCVQFLWPAYCDIPDPDSDIDPTSLSHPTIPPSDWLTEATFRLKLMFEAAGTPKTLEYLQPVLATFPREGGKILRELREMALWMKQKGPFRRCKKDLGLLAEILGLEDKGTYWQGDSKEDIDEK